MKTLTVRLDEKTLEAAQREARADGISMGELVRRRLTTPQQQQGNDLGREVESGNANILGRIGDLEALILEKFAEYEAE